MFGLLKAKNPYEQAASEAYAALLAQVRKPAFYTEFGVPDTQWARFDLLTVHIFMIYHVLLEKPEDYSRFNQALFDATFADMDQALRQVGIGDMGVPKRMRKLMKGFNGRMHAYQAALSGEQDLGEVLVRNVYEEQQQPGAEPVSAMKKYVQDAVDLIKNQPVSEIMEGRIAFPEV